jgi:hypothetical protein
MQNNITEDTAEIVRNLYVSGISEEFIALQLDLEVPVVVKILKDLNVYKQ